MTTTRLPDAVLRPAVGNVFETTVEQLATAIRLGDADGNDRTVGEPAWEPYLRTPTSGEFPCGH